MKQQSIESTGRIKFLSTSKGFGFISQENGQDIYFNIRNLQNNVEVGDEVIFLIESKNDRQSASAIRKVYRNRYGIAFYERINTTHTHLDIEEYLPEVVSNISNTNLGFMEIEHDFGNYVGLNDCVETSESDDLIYAIRKGRKGYTVFVKNRFPIPTSYVTIVLKKADNNAYVIITAFYGQKAGLEPHDPRATQSDIDFWKNHALIFRGEEIIKESITTTLPEKDVA